MTALPKSTYLRLLENRERSISRYRPDYPLVFFIALSRFSFGISIVCGILQISGRFEGTRVVMNITALGSLLLAIALSLTHLGAPKGFMRMVRNIRSRLTWEIGLSGIFLPILVANLVFLSLDMGGTRVTAALGVIMLVIAVSALISSGFAYQFSTHPSWNTNLLPIIYLCSGLILGLSFTGVVAQVVETAPFLQYASITHFILGFLILAQLSVGYAYIRYLKGFLDRTTNELLRGKSSTLFWTYMNLSFILPLLIILVALFRGGFELLPSVSLTVALLLGAYLERILFFSIEKPIYFFYYVGEKR